MRKPGAFENYRYRDELFPTSRFRMTFDVLEEQHGARASKEYLRILELAAKVSEAGVDQALRTLLNRPDEEITAERVKELVHADDHPGVRDVEVAAVDLRVFDRLCFSGEVMQ